MTFLDTNVLIYAFDSESPFYDWSREVIAESVVGEGAMVNPIVVAELCVGDQHPGTVAERIRSWGVDIVDLPAATAPVCATAFAEYRARRKRESDKDAPATPLPDFFIGAHALILKARLATADEGRYKTCFPDLTLVTPLS
ncbi:type II toxin-antitoxin system VapC family toxin [Aquisalimonas sp.]|uniref:type II toxin-antitoxin system VapC family toxin n=1 Tax=Aquisalimonas sp. TaxID=1872621 RepID=UPI0025BAA220|nr:PIN domain-containing protein [Aquisalimonas sp.]